MAYFRNASGDFVGDTGQVITDPNIRLQIGQSIGGDLNKLQLYNPSTAPTPAPTPAPAPTGTPNPAPTGTNPPATNNPAPVPTPGTPAPNPAPQPGSTNSGQTTPPTTTPTFSEFLKDPNSQTVYGYSSDGKLTAFSNWNDLLSVNGGKAPKIQTVQGLAMNDSAKNASIYQAQTTGTTGTDTGTNPDGTPKTDTTKTDTTGDTPPEDPVKKYVDLYTKAATDLGLPSIKTNIDDTTQKYSDLQNEKADKIQSINDNPWLDENTRQKSIDSINNRYVAKEQLLTSMLTLYNNQYTQGLNEANSIAGQVVADQKVAADNQQKALESNAKIVQDYGVSSPFYTIDGQTIINSTSGKVYSTYDQWVADGGGQGANVQMIGGQMSLKDQANFQIQLENANTSRINATKKTGSGSGSGSGSGNGVTTVGGNGVVIGGIKIPDNVSASDVEAILEGRNTLYTIRQTVGRSKEADAKMQALRDTISSIDPNFDFVASDAGAKFVSSTFYQKATTAITSVLPNIDEAIKLSDQVDRLGFAPVDKLLQSGQILFGNTKVANFHEAQKLIADEIGLALGQGSVSDMKLQLGFDITDPNLSADVFRSNLGIVKQFINNRLDALKNQRYTSSTTQTQSPSAPTTSTPTGSNGAALNTSPTDTVRVYKDGQYFLLPRTQLKDAVSQGYVVS